ncbi:RsmD family RNA methyltransferase, partial [Patescibacteria group bacterium]|nr:RsmD family RNA methyltransferase [Patescibacteria group bacterium]
MHKYFFILGRSPKLAQAEIESILPTLPGEYRIAESADDVLLLDLKIFGENGFQLKNFMKKLGGTIKVGKIIDEVENKNQAISTLTLERLLKKYLPQKEQKITFGFSLYNAGNSFSKSFQKDLAKTGIQIKIGLKKEGLKARFVTSKDKALSSVIVGENKLVERGADICIFFAKEKIYIGKTIAVQDYKSFSKFDYGRPRADAKSGMLPPKIARIMVNLAQTKPDEILLDPFCGSGTVLQEALLLGTKKVIGSDISRKAVDDTNKNLEWLASEIDFPESNYQILHSDVRELSINLKTKVDVIVTEPFLGPPLRGSESINHLQQNVKELSKLY